MSEEINQNANNNNKISPAYQDMINFGTNNEQPTEPAPASQVNFEIKTPPMAEAPAAQPAPPPRNSGAKTGA